VTEPNADELAARMSRRKSVLALYVSVAVALGLALVLWLVSRLVSVPVWLVVTLVAIQSVAVVGELVNVVVLSRQIRNTGPPRPPAAG
jgi:hypothetical protein